MLILRATVVQWLVDYTRLTRERCGLGCLCWARTHQVRSMALPLGALRSRDRHGCSKLHHRLCHRCVWGASSELCRRQNRAAKGAVCIDVASFCLSTLAAPNPIEPCHRVQVCLNSLDSDLRGKRPRQPLICRACLRVPPSDRYRERTLFTSFCNPNLHNPLFDCVPRVSFFDYLIWQARLMRHIHHQRRIAYQHHS